MDFFYKKNIRLLLLTKYNTSSIYDINGFKNLDLTMSLTSLNKIEALTALSILTSKTAFFSFSKSKSSSQNKYEVSTEIVCFSLVKQNLFMFLEKLLFYYLPNIRYFKGFSNLNFNENGDFFLSLDDLLIFPELEEELEFFYNLSGLRVSLLGKNFDTSNQSMLLFYLFGFEINLTKKNDFSRN
jgi:ribosomal protein L5